IGFGQGHHVKELLNRLGSKGYVNVLLLNPKAFVLFLSSENVSELLSDPRCGFIWGGVQRIATHLQENYAPSSNPAYPRVYYHDPSLATADTTLHPLVDIIRRLQTERTRNKIVGPIVTENYRRNMGWIPVSRGVDELKGSLAKRPAIVIAAGPSLDQSVDRLSLFKERVPLLTVDTAARSLFFAGIVPDLVLTSDPNRASLKHFEDIALSFPLAFLPSANWTVLMQHQGPKWVAFPHGDKLGEALNAQTNKGMVWVAGTITYFALEVARRLGCDPVIFVGLDLALTGGKSHAGAAQSAKPSLNRLEVPAICGGKVETTDHLDSFRRAIETRIAQDPDCTFVDTKENGAIIRGTISCSLEEVEKRWCHNLDKIPNPFDGPPVLQPVTVPIELVETWENVTGNPYLRTSSSHKSNSAKKSGS
ncbi:MAG: 6-hydroxymethylpterin diphosphokinase MptE-like protein, partial [Pseudomonadota bacterium]